MKLAAVYNVWDGEELLPHSIDSIYDHVDGIYIVYQDISNYGEKNPGLQDALSDLEVSGKVKFIKHDPDTAEPGMVNEIAKRSKGVIRAKHEGYTHFLLVDTDEIYDKRQFKNAKAKIINNDYDATACGLYTYYKKPTWQMNPIEKYCVPFITKIKEGMQLGNVPYPVMVDPTRRTRPADNFHLFPNDELMMHHYSYVRTDIARKLNNSSANVNWKDKIPDMVRQFEEHTDIKNDLIFLFKGHNLVEVDNKFNISWPISKK